VKGAGNSAEMGLGMAYVGMTGLGLPLVPFLLLEKGKDALLPAGTKFTAYMNGEVPLDRTTFEKVQPAVRPCTAARLLWLGCLTTAI
jgi:hypothetical protein